jgi:hypothetical protein
VIARLSNADGQRSPLDELKVRPRQDWCVVGRLDQL